VVEEELPLYAIVVCRSHSVASEGLHPRTNLLFYHCEASSGETVVRVRTANSRPQTG
jgi:hypothetical protein